MVVQSLIFNLVIDLTNNYVVLLLTNLFGNLINYDFIVFTEYVIFLNDVFGVFFIYCRKKFSCRDPPLSICKKNKLIGG